jgi:FtsP/CotA-like multicopper oxidase with cupredoxin domain
MNNFSIPGSNLTRRRFIAVATASAITPLVAIPLSFSVQATSSSELSLRAAQGRVRLVPEPYNETDAWCYNDTVPGPEIRVRQGDRLRVAFANDLVEETTMHFSVSPMEKTDAQN